MYHKSSTAHCYHRRSNTPHGFNRPLPLAMWVCTVGVPPLTAPYNVAVHHKGPTYAAALALGYHHIGDFTPQLECYAMRKTLMRTYGCMVRTIRDWLHQHRGALPYGVPTAPHCPVKKDAHYPPYCPLQYYSLPLVVL